MCAKVHALQLANPAAEAATMSTATVIITFRVQSISMEGLAGAGRTICTELSVAFSCRVKSDARRCVAVRWLFSIRTVSATSCAIAFRTSLDVPPVKARYACIAVADIQIRGRQR